MKKKQKIRVLLVDDHPVVREGLRSCLAGYGQIEVVGEAVDGEDALSKAEALKPEVVLLDINLPRSSGLQATERLQKEMPEIKVLALSAHPNQEYVHRMVALGARGYVLKETSPQELVRAIETVQKGDNYFSPGVLNGLVRELATGDKRWAGASGLPLSQREQEVLTLIAEGLGNKQIAATLGVSVRTVETHRERLMDKLNIRSIAGLTRFAIARGLLKLNP